MLGKAAQRDTLHLNRGRRRATSPLPSGALDQRTTGRGQLTSDDRRFESPHLPALFAASLRFRSPAVVGRGSMGVVYRVLDTELGCEVALKTLHARAPDEIYRLKNEFRALARVVHPNLVQLYDLVVTDTECFFTMQFVDGVDFVAHVRGPQQPDQSTPLVERFLHAAPQLVRGIDALHAAGRLHRDVKPSNTLVTADGHVVLLDFDLAAPLTSGDRQQSNASSAAGTFAYMAPEQVWEAPVTPAADLYAVGVVFYEALAGRLPFDVPPERLYMAKIRAAPPRLPSITPEVPVWLDEMVRALLRPDAGQRPTAADVLARLSAAAPSEEVRDTPRSAATFVGRGREMATLRAACDPSARSNPTVVCVSGVSGIGKTELLQRLVGDLEAEDALVLRSRCHQQESVSYKALDPIVDALSRVLLALPDEQVAALRPMHGDALVRLFPVLARVPALTAIGRRGEQLDALEFRRRGFAAFRGLLTRVAQMRRLVLWVDDLQWGDADSAILIGELLRPPDPPPLTLLLSFRSEERERIPLFDMLAELAGDQASPTIHHLDLAPLDDQASRALATQLCPAAFRSADTVATLAAQSGGSPFLLTALSWHVSNDPPRGDLAALGWRQVVGARIQRLPEDLRRLVELVAVAGGPVDRSVVLQAARQGEAGRPRISRLENELLLRATTVGGRPAVEAYHDRIRESAVADLEPAALLGCHADLAVAFESSGRAEPEVLAHHFHGAGQLARAADHAVAAADRASDTLAFVRASELYRQARDWDPRDPAWTRVLLTREGDALANAARFSDAAQVLLAAAEGAARRDALDLRRRAAENLLAAGRIDDGVASLSAVLRDLGLTYPRTQQRAMLGAAAHIGRLALGRRAASVAAPAPEELLRVDTCYSAGKALVNIDPPRGVYFSLVALHHALRAGEPERLGCALSVVGGSLRVVGGMLFDRLGQALLGEAEAIYTRTQSPRVRGTIDVSVGQVLMLQGHWKASIARCDAGVRVLAEHCRGVAPECNVGRGIPLRAVEEIGDLVQIEARSLELLQAGAVLRDRLAEAMGSQHMSTALLARDDVEGARAFPRRIWDAWSRQSFHLQHLYVIRQEAMCDLYEGCPERAHERLLAAWPQARRANLLRVSLARVDALSIRGRLALAMAAASGDRRLLRAAAQDARRLRRERRGDADVHSALLAAGAATLQGDAAAASARLDEAIAAAERSDMALHAAVARYRRAQLLGPSAGAALDAAARAQMAASRILAPERWADVYAPGRWSH